MKLNPKKRGKGVFNHFCKSLSSEKAGEIALEDFKYKNILISPLDWGLGHATRIVPLIRAFEDFECTVTIACSGATERLLRGEFPGALFISLPGYGVVYPRKGGFFLSKILSQLPRILFNVWKEHTWLRRQQAIHRWDAVVSDNRYGLHHSDMPSVIITHQLHIRTGVSGLLDGLVRRLLFRRLSRFDECWVPDAEHEPTLSGALSHGMVPGHVRYLGPLSRFGSLGVDQERGRVLVLLSGPEPQRSIFEGRIEEQLRGFEGDILIVRGLPGGGGIKPDAGSVRWVNHLPAKELALELSSASLVIARSGYSTVMDLVRTGRRAVLVPTPGQTEQEYLARHLSDAGRFLSVAQSDFDLRKAVSEGLSLPIPSLKMDFDHHREVVRGFLLGNHHRKP